MEDKVGVRSGLGWDVRMKRIATRLLLGAVTLVACAPRSTVLLGYSVVVPEARIDDMNWRRSGSSIVVRRNSTVEGGEKLITLAERLHPTRRQVIQTLRRAHRGLAEDTDRTWDSLPDPAWAHPSGGDALLPFSLNASALSYYVSRVHRAAERWPSKPLSDDPLSPPMPAREGAEMEYSAQVDTATDRRMPGARYRVRLRLVYHESPGSVHFVKFREVWFGANDEVLGIAGDGLTRRIF